MDSKVSRKNNSEIDFKSSLGLSIDSVFENDVVVEFEECELDMSSIENEVIELDPDINTLASQSLVAKEQLRASRLKKFPDVYFIGEYGRSSDSSEQDNFSLGLGFELNLFDSGQNNALQREANNILRVSELKIDQRLNDLLSATKREMLNIEESEQRYLKLLEIVGNARESYYGAVKLFEREGITYSETKRLLETYTDSKDDLREALRDYSQAKSRLEIMIGNSDGT
ncbi:hypothetical protein COV11_01220 [Candidatus Woesearchaeota archaeon CG10_big_fil_rev_8_21_14_0_10_30_7]|nr:MAG: hypothetical protein COV11_01220 [Candidatus Woesearchaeota archaeon CG10_big_fil_rev_8_21_14_0_10_30_7]